MDFNKVETWVTLGLLAYIAFKVTESPTPTPGGCSTVTETGWEVSNLLASGAASTNSALGRYPQMGCSCE